MEMNPGTASKKKCRALYQMGINRLSMGLQSTNDMELKTLGRIHSYEDFINTYTWCRSRFSEYQRGSDGSTSLPDCGELYHRTS